MRIAVFTGPTLWNDPILRTRGIEWHPPAAQGDVYRIARSRPFAIGLIDGCFESTPSVWHKEILWAMSRGVHVFGAASMGALRAAELAPFGMVGVGAIFRDFQSGHLTDDDEVAVLHEPRELLYRPLTESMVDIRATLAAAVVAEIISPRTASSLRDRAKALFFKERTWPRILGTRKFQSTEECRRLTHWLP